MDRFIKLFYHVVLSTSTRTVYISFTSWHIQQNLNNKIYLSTTVYYSAHSSSSCGYFPPNIPSLLNFSLFYASIFFTCTIYFLTVQRNFLSVEIHVTLGCSKAAGNNIMYLHHINYGSLFLPQTRNFLLAT